LQLISGPKINELLTEPDNRLGRLLSSGVTPDEALEELYWASLSRPPTEEERSAARARLDTGDLRSGLEDVAWAVLNSKEFLLRQ
jgi:hypothetical protein